MIQNPLYFKRDSKNARNDELHDWGLSVQLSRIFSQFQDEYFDAELSTGTEAQHLF